MRRHWIAVLGIVLLIVGIAGAAVTGALLAGTQQGAPARRGNTAQPPSGGISSNGERIYLTAVGHAGPIARVGGPMMGVACVNCHGQDGRGGRISMMMGTVIDVPDIRYSTLTSPRTEEGTTTPGWTESEIASAIRDGVEPGGKRLNSFMPRWNMDDTDLNAVIGYLKELDSR